MVSSTGFRAYRNAFCWCAARQRRQGEGQRPSQQAWAKLQAAVKAGKITKEDALARITALKKRFSAKGTTDKGKADKGKADYKGDGKQVGDALENIWAGLRALVASGKISAKDAEAIISTIKKKVYVKDDKSDKDHKDGKYQKGDNKAELDAYFQRVWVELQAAVKAGKMTQEEATAKMIAIKKAKLNQ